MAETLFAHFGRAYRAGEVLFREGDRGGTMFVIQSGLVRTSKASGDGEHAFDTLGGGEFLGEMSSPPETPRPITATAIEDMTCLEISIKALETMMSRNRESAQRVQLDLRPSTSADDLAPVLRDPDPEARFMLCLWRCIETGEATPSRLLDLLSAEAPVQDTPPTAAEMLEVLAGLTHLGILSRDEAGGTMTLRADVPRLLDEAFGRVLTTWRLFEFLDVHEVGSPG